MQLLTEDNLSQLSEEELEKLYQVKQAEYDQKIAKNRRIRVMLSDKVSNKQNIVNNLQKKIDDFLAAHPEVAKQDFYRKI